MSSWSIPETITRTGASHARRGVVCQDASGRQSVKDRDGQLVHVMVVADGHGGKRYTQSDTGSRLACELSMKLVAEQLGQWTSVGGGARQRWQEWLEATFSSTLHQRWLEAIETHWRVQSSETEAAEAPFSPLAYGTTIALVMMAPTWWGHTGLGDWDLVRIGSDGEVELINEEQEEEHTGGEATYSLCLNNAPRHFAARTAVHPIQEQQPPFSLMLSTDGVRKSCSTDTDFFAIARYLSEAEHPRQGNAAIQLDADLDRISSQGSGDDVSVAIGRWMPLRERPQRPGRVRRRIQRLEQSEAVIVQPSKHESRPSIITTAPGGSCLPDHRNEVASDTGIAGAQGYQRKTFRHVPGLLPSLVAVSVVALGTVGMTWWLGLGPFARDNSSSPEPDPTLKAVLLQTTEDLCKPEIPFDQNPEYDGTSNNTKGIHKPDDDPNLNPAILGSINANLNQRKNTFSALASGAKSPHEYLVPPFKDSVSTLIAWSLGKARHDPPISSSKATRFLGRFTDVIAHWNKLGGTTPPQGFDVVLCPELRQALKSQWTRAKSEAARRRTRDEIPLKENPSSPKSNSTVMSNIQPIVHQQEEWTEESGRPTLKEQPR